MTKFDRYLWAIGHIQRRRLLLELLETPAIHTSELNMSEGETKLLLAEVKHAHLPKLADHDVIDWNPERNRVKRGSKFEEVKPLLELLDANRERLPDGWM
ncbi:transcriptional regulator [Haloterrigena sp. H1]|uniref:transcriptional regulator n=1 Tax=Haloterrigena sp. H1 TaxID=2552943 RepID=UPI001BB2CEC4|nr:transcriptional regulator [Haloterrigena sp. H1]